MTHLKRTQFRLERSIEEKVTLLREVHHRVKDNLQIIVSHLRLQAHDVEEEQTRRALKDSTERALSVADNGPGLPRGFEPARTGTLGTALVVSLCDQLGARSNWESDGGTRFTVTVPVSARQG